MSSSTYNLTSIILVIVLVGFGMAAGTYLLTLSSLSSESPVTGGVISRLLIVEVNDRECNMTFVQDFNLVSVHCMPANNSPGFVFSQIQSNLTSIHAYRNSEIDKWKAYNPSLPGWVVQDLSVIHPEVGLWVRVTDNSSLSINGSYQLPATVDLFEGWNLAGYPLAIEKNVTDALGNIDGIATRILGYYSYDQSDPWKLFDPFQDPLFNDLTIFRPLYGYWINASQDVEWYLEE
jgi:hypothetical protein